MARTGGDGPKGISALLVEDGTARPLLRRAGDEDGLEGAADRAGAARRLPGARPANLLGEEGEGFTLRHGRASTAAGSTSPPRRSAAPRPRSTRRSPTPAERRAFGHTLNKFQALQFRLADMETELQAARIFLYQAAWKLDRKAPDATKHCAMAKRLVTDTAFKVANDALQLLGGYGYLADYGIEKIVRDLRVHQILEGTNEIMRVIVARALLGDARHDRHQSHPHRGPRRPHHPHPAAGAERAQPRDGRRDRRRPRRLGATTRPWRWCSSTPRASAPSAPAATSPSVYRTGRRGDFAHGRRFWADEYRMNAPIARYPKPVVALMHGFVMGGGVGVAGHASHRVVGETHPGRDAGMRHRPDPRRRRHAAAGAARPAASANTSA